MAVENIKKKKKKKRKKKKEKARKRNGEKENEKEMGEILAAFGKLSGKKRFVK